ncbi:hypothetical protein HPB47_000750 [Ixodes persulcatus]|uniref:Uncharacterized protein n=1 Tax=Ixodes persulcatus TaxID=34615 RepID=A0AC60PSD9_IXOPE|nr:hypothetical protein HPB47_000750 [Ixodes persulcatus]
MPSLTCVSRPWTRTAARGLSQRARLDGHDTGIRVYDPIGRAKVPLKLQHERVAKWYSCGPTVYDSSHVGHAYTYLRTDIIRRILGRFFDVDVVMVMGITDIDDKIIARAVQLGETPETLARRYEREFREDIAKLGVLPPTVYARVSEYVPSVVRFCEVLRDKGHAYVAPDGSLYFDVSQRSDYGLFRAPGAGSSVPVVEPGDKRDPRDFALWKGAKPGEPQWTSPWGPGRPGWHIECSAMASELLGNSVDIHTGGRDLAFPHHENEEAQSRSRYGKSRWVRHWLHMGQVMVAKGGTEKVKMSKSAGNTLPLQTVLEDHSAETLRLLCLRSHYGADVVVGPEALHQAQVNLSMLRNFCASAGSYVRGELPARELNEPELLEQLADLKIQLREAMADDLDYSQATARVLELASRLNGRLQGPCVQTSAAGACRGAVAAALVLVSRFFGDVGIELATKDTLASASGTSIALVVDSVVAFRSVVRQHALAHKDSSRPLLEACDSLRDQLALEGVQIKDRGSQSSTWDIVPVGRNREKSQKQEQ